MSVIAQIWFFASVWYCFSSILLQRDWILMLGWIYLCCPNLLTRSMVSTSWWDTHWFICLQKLADKISVRLFAMPLQVLVTYVHFYSHFNKVCHVLRRKYIMAWKLCHHYKILMFQQTLLQKMMKCISKE